MVDNLQRRTTYKADSEISIGKEVLIHGLEGPLARYNGREGRTARWVIEEEMWEVRFGTSRMCFAAANLRGKVSQARGSQAAPKSLPRKTPATVNSDETTRESYEKTDGDSESNVTSEDRRDQSELVPDATGRPAIVRSIAATSFNSTSPAAGGRVEWNIAANTPEMSSALGARTQHWITTRSQGADGKEEYLWTAKGIEMLRAENGRPSPSVGGVACLQMYGLELGLSFPRAPSA